MRGICQRCKKYGEVVMHHTYRRRNRRNVTVGLCPACHQWVHLNIAEARKEGFYKQMDSEYRPKKKSSKSWKQEFIEGTYLKKDTAK